MENRISQIINGNKAIQIYDLPIFTDLLKVSCEEILSCGKSFVPFSGHITNYEVAFSKDTNVWDNYAERPDNLILNPDEYNKTVIDYAIEFKNYDFIKYLIDKDYIWFVDNSKYDSYVLSFGAGTNIKRRDIPYIDTALNYEMAKCEELGLRQKVIAMAIENKDFDILDSLKAREVPELYFECLCWGSRTDSRAHYNDDLIEAIVQSNNDKVLAYFSDEFQITDNQKREHSFIFPFLNEVIDKLVKLKSKKAEPIIRKAIEHNEKVYGQLSNMINEVIKHLQHNCPYWKKFIINDVKNEIMYGFKFIDKDGFISYTFVKSKEECLRMCANVIRTDATSNDLLISSLINELNKSFIKVKNIESIIFMTKEEK